MTEIWTLLIERKEFFSELLLEHLKISFIAILIAILLGGLIGIIITQLKGVSQPVLGCINFLYTIPSISMLGFLIPFSGVGNTTAIIALIIYALLPMVRNTYTGLTNIDAGILEAAKGMGSTRMQILIKIKLPLALPVIMSGIRSMVTMTIALGGIASFIGAGGLGVAIYRGITTNQKSMTMAGSLLIALLAIVMDLILGFVEHRMKKRGKLEKQRNRKMVFAAAVLCIVLTAVSVMQFQKEETIHIATKPMTEQYVMGEMLDLLIEQDTDLNVEITQGVGGGTSNIQPGMESKEFDLYPEYTGTAWNMVLKRKDFYTEKHFSTLQASYKKKFEMEWAGMYGFNNTYGIAVRKEIADKYHLKNYSDLKAVAGQLRFGAEYDFFERKDGYDALCEAYGLKFQKTMDLDIGLKYQALNQGKIDVMVIFTTDGQLSASDVVVLKDDQEFYPSYQCGNIVRSEVLEKHPELREVLDKLTGTITDHDMAEMNYAVEEKGKEPRNVARTYLQKKNLLD